MSHMGMTVLRYFLDFLVISMLSAFSLLHGQEIFRDTIQYAGQERSYLLYIPAAYEEGDDWPLVMVLHGGGDGNGEDLLIRHQFDEVADTAHYLCFYPNGIANQWADGRGATTPDVEGVDDVQFLKNVLDTLALDFTFDHNNVFVTGPSNGGMMTQRLACESPGTFRAYATMIASMPVPVAETCTPGISVPMLLMNGTEDVLVPYEGGPLSPLTDGGSVTGTDSTIQFWRENNGCTSNAQIVSIEDTDTTDGSTVEYTEWSGCADDTEVVLYRIEGGGHTVPGMASAQNPRPLAGFINYDIDAATEIWAFFKSHLAESGTTSTTPAYGDAQIKVFPNPTSDFISISGLPTSGNYTMKIMDGHGRIITEQNKSKLDLTAIAPGLYFLQISLNGQMVNRKFIKQP
ncbi:MAG: T9SS type A sorting domain-containing protein [Bacteroidota bacterium]